MLDVAALFSVQTRTEGSLEESLAVLLIKCNELGWNLFYMSLDD